jgi:hypothetical protein
VLKEGKDPADALRQFERFPEYYQADTLESRPHFSRAIA